MGVNLDAGRDGDGGGQVGVDLGVFAEGGGDRVEEGVTVNVDGEVDPDGGGQTSLIGNRP